MGSFVCSINTMEADRHRGSETPRQHSDKHIQITDKPVTINYEQTEDTEERSGEFKLELFLD